MKHYETLFVLKPTLTEEEASAQVETMRALLEKNGAEIILVKNYGPKNLAYEIKKNRRGVFVNIFFKAPADAVKELERVYRITEDIIKFMTVKYETKKELQAWEIGTKSGVTSIFTASQRSHRRERPPRGDRPDYRSDRGDRSERGERAERQEPRESREPAKESATTATGAESKE